MPKPAAIHYLNVYYSRKNSSSSAQKAKTGGSLTSATLPNMNVLGQVIGIMEPENRKVDKGVLTFVKVKVIYAVYPLRPFRAV